MSNSRRNQGRTAPAEIKSIRASAGGLKIVAMDGEQAKGSRKIKMALYTGEPIRQYSWSDPIIIDLAGVKFTDKPRPVLFNHSTDIDHIAGTTTAISVDASGVQVEAVLNGSPELVAKLGAMLDAGFPFQSSIGADVIREEYVKTGQSVTVNGRELTGPLVVAREVQLTEASIVALGADDNTSTNLAAMRAAIKENRMPDEVKTADAPVDPTESIKAATDAAIKSRREAEAAEARRIDAINEKAKGHLSIAAEAIEKGWTVEKTQLEVLLAERPKAPAGRVPRDDGNTASVIEANLVFGVLNNSEHREKLMLKAYGEKTLEAAEKVGTMGLRDIVASFLRANGQDCSNVGDREIRAALELDKRIRAGTIHASGGFSTIGLSGLLSNAANKVLLDSFMSFQSVVPSIARERDVPDFKSTSSYRLTVTGEAELIPQNGELPKATLAEEVFTNRARTRGMLIMLTREQIVNDDLNAFAAIPRGIAYAAYLARERAAIGILAGSSGAGLFTAANNNFLTGTDTALSVDSTSAAWQQFLRLVDTNGDPIGVMPRTMLVGPSNAVLANQIYNDSYVNETTAAGAAQPAGNPHRGLFRPLVSPFLQNPKITGNSATAWYLFANPAEVAALEVVYVQGRRTPTIEAVEADASQLGMGFRGTYEFNVAAMDPRGAIKLAGA